MCCSGFSVNFVCLYLFGLSDRTHHHNIKGKDSPSRLAERERKMGHDEENTAASTPTTTDQEEEAWNQRKEILIHELSEKLINGDLQTQIEAARDIRKVVKKSSVKTRTKFATAGVIQPLVLMLVSPNLDACEASLLALLNLAVRNERFVSFSLSFTKYILSLSKMDYYYFCFSFVFNR